MKLIPGHRGLPLGIKSYRIPYFICIITSCGEVLLLMKFLTGGTERWTSIPIRRLCGGEICPLGIRGIWRPWRRAWNPDAGWSGKGIGKTYKEAFQYPINEIGRYGLGFAKDFSKKISRRAWNVKTPVSERQFIMYEALRKGADVEDVFTDGLLYKPYFIKQMELVEEEEKILTFRGSSPLMMSWSVQKRWLPTGICQSCSNVRKWYKEKRAPGFKGSMGTVRLWWRGRCSNIFQLLMHPTGKGEQQEENHGSCGGPTGLWGIEFDYCCVPLHSFCDTGCRFWINNG